MTTVAPELFLFRSFESQVCLKINKQALGSTSKAIYIVEAFGNTTKSCKEPDLSA